MKMMTKFLALMPLVVLGAACGGSSPVAPSNPLATDEGSAIAANTSAASKNLAPDTCRDITGVNLEVLPSTSKPGIVLQATYVRFGGSAIRCAAPVWTSDPRGALITNQLSAFRMGVTSMRPVTVTAMAPNGVKGSLTLQGKTADLDASAVCKNVSAVKMTLVPTTNMKTLVRASYLSFGPSIDRCAAPVWSSDPRGALNVTKDPFVVGVSSIRPLTVIATAPNGRSGKITLNP